MRNCYTMFSVEPFSDFHKHHNHATKFHPTLGNTTPIEFDNVQAIDGNVNYVALIPQTLTVEQSLLPSTAVLAAAPKVIAVSDESEDPFNMRKSAVNGFFVGSLTVVGLYVLYSMLLRK